MFELTAACLANSGPLVVNGPANAVQLSLSNEITSNSNKLADPNGGVNAFAQHTSGQRGFHQHLTARNVAGQSRFHAASQKSFQQHVIHKNLTHIQEPSLQYSITTSDENDDSRELVTSVASSRLPATLLRGKYCINN